MERKEAKALGLKTYFNGSPCLRGHLSERRTSTGTCIECSAIHQKSNDEKRKSNPNRKAYMKKYLAVYHQKRKENPEELEKMRAQSRDSYAKNIELERARSIEKRKSNRDYYYQKCAERRARAKSATPTWFKSETKEIQKIYSKAKELNLEVDHIVPLVSDVVCGLHCFANLQLLSRSENARKSNKSWPDMA